MAQAELLAFIDADCVAAPGWVRAIVGFMEGRADIAFLGGDIRIRPVKPERLTAIEAYESVFSYRARLYVERYGFAATGNMAVRSAVFPERRPVRRHRHDGGYRLGQAGECRGTSHRLSRGRDGFHGALRVVRRPRPPLDRHVAHEFRKVGRHPVDILVLGCQELRHCGVPADGTAFCGPLRSHLRPAGPAPRANLHGRVRLYRARLMLTLLLRDNTAALVGSWNREKS